MPGVAGVGVRGAGFIVRPKPPTPWGSAGGGFLPFFRPGHDDLSDLSAAQFLAHDVDDGFRFCDDPVRAFLQSWCYQAMAVHAPDRTVCRGCVVGGGEKDTLPQHCTVALSGGDFVLALPGASDR